MQPTFLGWAGYFSLIDNVDLFVFYDVAQYSRLSYHSRARVCRDGRYSWLSLPVQQNFGQALCETKISHPHISRKKLIATLNSLPTSNNVASAECFKNNLLLKLADIDFSNTTLALLNRDIIVHMSKELNLSGNFLATSELLKFESKPGLTREEKLRQILVEVGASEYYCGPSGFGYLTKEFFSEIGVIPVLQLHSPTGKLMDNGRGELLDEIYLGAFQRCFQVGVEGLRRELTEHFSYVSAF